MSDVMKFVQEAEHHFVSATQYLPKSLAWECACSSLLGHRFPEINHRTFEEALDRARSAFIGHILSSIYASTNKDDVR